jgi:ectoine hydroxylase-related dioxygenase (phytanoyl-CoA dioxygenase family)
MSFDTDGFAIVPSLLTNAEAATLAEAANRAYTAPRQGGLRNILHRIPAIRQLATSAAIRNLIQPILGNQAFPVRGILFDKTPDSNWKVPWHQDLTIAVEEKIDTPGFGPWTIKDGAHHVQPPTAILESMLAVRIHLDDCNDDNGPLRVIPGSHTHGRLTAEQIHSLAIQCTVARGGALLMRPLLLHASSAATSPRHRRVIHIEFASQPLPGALRWLSC